MSMSFKRSSRRPEIAFMEIAIGVMAMVIGSALFIGVGWAAFAIAPLISLRIGENWTLSLMMLALVLPFAKWIGQGFLSIRR